YGNASSQRGPGHRGRRANNWTNTFPGCDKRRPGGELALGDYPKGMVMYLTGCKRSILGRSCKCDWRSGCAFPKYDDPSPAICFVSSSWSVHCRWPLCYPEKGQGFSENRRLFPDRNVQPPAHACLYYAF